MKQSSKSRFYILERNMIHIVSSNVCPYCSAAKQLLTSLGYEYEETVVNMGSPELMEIVQMTGQMTVPQIFAWNIAKENLIGGYDELTKLQSMGKLEERLKQV